MSRAFLCVAVALILAGCASDARVEPAPQPLPPAPPPAPVTIEPCPGIVIQPAIGRVELAARTCLTEGWLEQIACGRGTREHESLVVPQASALEIHTALLLAGHEPGAPGKWRWQDEVVHLDPPTGTGLVIRVRVGAGPEVSIWDWVRDPSTGNAVDGPSFVFAGSRFETMPDLGEVYLADYSGSIIGLVTFGDEVIGCATVFADDASVFEPAWEVFSERVPPYGTDVTIIIEPAN